MADNETPHRAHLVDEFLQTENISRMDWPDKSLDLNGIENVSEVVPSEKEFIMSSEMSSWRNGIP